MSSYVLHKPAYAINKVRVYIGKNDNHRGTMILFTSTFSRFAEKTKNEQRNRPEMIRSIDRHKRSL